MADPIEALADSLGLQASALRLLVSLILGFPISAVYAAFIARLPPYLHHLYFILAATFLGYFNFGSYVVHNLLSTLLVVVFIQEGCRLHFFRATPAIVLLASMAHFLYGVAKFATDDYDIDWTLSQCVLVLRFIQLAWDVSDGDPLNTRPGNNPAALKIMPSLLAMSGYCLYYGAFLVGPQYSMQHYLAITSGQLKVPPLRRRVWPTLIRTLASTLYLGLTIVGMMFVPVSAMWSDDIMQHPLWYRIGYMVVAVRLQLCQYVGIWMLNEAVNILGGMGYGGPHNWRAMANVRAKIYEGGATLHSLVKGFNITTNNWSKVYLFKRLKFLGNKFLSTAITLTFLALWHGYHFGYYVTFALELFGFRAEAYILELVGMPPDASLKNLFNGSGLKNSLLTLVLWIQKGILFPYCLLPFFAKEWHRALNAMYAVAYFGHIYVVGVLILSFAMPVRKAHQKDESATPESQKNKAKEQ